MFFLSRVTTALTVLLWALASAATPKFNIVIDAGSTGCRLYVYQTDSEQGLVGKKGPKVKPGLSSFTTHPQDLKEYIKPLFVEAQSLIPESEWAETPVYIKATAGMRLVTEEQGRVIYDTVHAYLSSTPDVCPFSVSRTNMQTIDGVQEGYFGALSANFLAGIIDKDRGLLHPQGSSAGGGVLGALDLGGSSTQVSIYEAANTATISASSSSGTAAPPGVEKQDFKVHSYLGFGVEKMAEKYAAFLSSKGAKEDPCLPPSYTDAATGAVGTGSYAACKETVAEALGVAKPCVDGGGGRCQMDGVRLPAVGPDDKFLAMSVYYFALRSVLVTLGKEGGSLGKEKKVMSWPSPSLAELAAAGEQFCGIPWPKLEALVKDDSLGWEEFMGDAAQRAEEIPQRCRQAAYIDMLLGKVYGIPEDKHNVMIALDINDMEVEWTLGSVISVSPGPGAAGASSGGSSTIFDVFLIFFCIFATLLVAVLCIKMMLSPRKGWVEKRTYGLWK